MSRYGGLRGKAVVSIEMLVEAGLWVFEGRRQEWIRQATRGMAEVAVNVKIMLQRRRACDSRNTSAIRECVLPWPSPQRPGLGCPAH
jgi:hypothetical protein